MERVPFVDLKAQYASIKAEVDEAVARVISSTGFIGGPEVKGLEEEFAAFCQGAAAAGVGNGTDALYLALRALKIGPGDEVITVPHTFIATAEAISGTGATVRFVDVDLQSGTMDPQALEQAITKRTKAVIPVHLYGLPADMEPILALAKAHQLKVVEDAAQAHGATYRGRPVGALGDLGCFSFYPGKNLGAYGDAGAVVGNDPALVGMVRKLSNHGRQTKYEHLMEGVNSRLDALQAAVLRVKLRHLPRWNRQRQHNAALYKAALEGLEQVVCPPVLADRECVFHLYVVRVPERDRVLKGLEEDGISCGVHYPVPLHLQPAYRALGLGPGSFPATEQLAREILSLPMYPELGESQILRVAEALRRQVT